MNIEIKNKIIEDYQNNVFLKLICEKYSLSIKQVRKVLKESGVYIQHKTRKQQNPLHKEQERIRNERISEKLLECTDFELIEQFKKGKKFMLRLKHIPCGNIMDKSFHNFIEGYGCSKCKGIKIKATKKEKYGDENYVNSDKRESTNLEKYGNKHNWGKDSKVRIKCMETTKKKYGVLNYTKSEEFKELWKDSEFTKNRNVKGNKTKKSNRTFNVSKVEMKIIDYYKLNNINFEYQYSDEKYPFLCDFYFPDKELYVEINAMWTHGKEPFDESKTEHILLKEDWQKKSLESKFYKNALYVWTDLDIRKKDTAIKNGLKLLSIYSNDADVCINKINEILK
jgi:hypothetical protein